jgi:maltose/moltooligosaccharide transporter
MSAISTVPPGLAGDPAPQIFRVGTLQYGQKDLYVLFVWLMWNEFTMMLLQDPQGFGGFLQKDFGATNEQISIFGTIGTLMGVIINPVCSTWSDRTRTRWGRRRPFLAVLTPPLALCTLLLPYMPDITKHLDHVGAIHAIFGWFSAPMSPHTLAFLPDWLRSTIDIFPINETVLMLGLCTLGIGFFNSFVGTLFSYLYWDVVPQEVLGRWTALNKMITSICSFIWLFFFFGLADNHMKALCVGVSLFAAAAYLLSIYKVKEGAYPPVDKHVKGGRGFASIRAYFVECFGHSYYLWIFAGFGFASINWGTGGYMDFYLRYNLHLNYTSMGWLKGVPGLVSLVMGYYLGSMADKLHPLRIFGPTFLLLAVIYVGSFFFIHDKWSFLFWSVLIQVGQFANGITVGALMPQIFPREKFGQFCSANAACSMIVNMVLGIPMARMFDLLHSNYRYAYLVAAFSMAGAGVLFHKVYLNYEARHGKSPVPHAG